MSWDGVGGCVVEEGVGGELGMKRGEGVKLGEGVKVKGGGYTIITGNLWRIGIILRHERDSIIAALHRHLTTSSFKASLEFLIANLLERIG